MSLTENLCGVDQPGLSIYRSSKVTFDANKSVDSAGEAKNLEYSWDFGDGVYSSQKVANHYYTELTKNKCLEITLTVKDLKTLKTAKSEKLYLKVVNHLPTLNFLEIIPSGELITPVTFKLNARGVADNDGKVIKYRWWYYREGDSRER